MHTNLICLTIAAIALCSNAYANRYLDIADSCYAVRAEHSHGETADAKNALLMTQNYFKAMSDSTVYARALEGYVKSLYFSFRFVPFDKKKRRPKLDSLKEISEDAYHKYPANTEIARIYAGAISMWGNERGALVSVKEGVATTVRNVATAANDYQVLGRAHYLLPYIPFILSWPDKKLADKYLVLALQKEPEDLYNYFFLAELRFSQKRYSDALSIIERGLARGLRTNYFLEDKRGRRQLKELQNKINTKLSKKK